MQWTGGSDAVTSKFFGLIVSEVMLKGILKYIETERKLSGVDFFFFEMQNKYSIPMVTSCQKKRHSKQFLWNAKNDSSENKYILPYRFADNSLGICWEWEEF